MAKFNFKKWIIENKHGKLSEMKYDDPFNKKEDDPKNPMGIPEIEKDPDAQAAAPKGGEGESEAEAKPELDAAAITNKTSYGELSGVEDAQKILSQLSSRDVNQPIYKAMTWVDDDGGSHPPDPEKIADWVDGIGIDTLAQRMVALGDALPSTGLPKDKMPFLPLPNDPKSKGDPADVGDALTPGEGKYGVDFKEAVDPPAPNSFVGMKDKAAQDYMQSGEKDGDPMDDKAAFEKDPSIAASEAKPTQQNILIAKSIGMAANGVEGGNLGAYFSTDNEILDGHHRWAATMLNNPGADIGGIAAIDLKAMGGTKPALKHLTAIGNALGNATKTTEAKDPRSSLYEQLENHISKNLNEYTVDYYVVYDKSTGEEASRYQKPPNPDGALRDAKKFIQSMDDWHEREEKERYERWESIHPSDGYNRSPFQPNPKREYEIGSDTESHSMEE